MKRSIDKLKEELEELKTSAVSITLRNHTLKKIKGEQDRLEIKSRSKMIELIMNIYFQLPLEEEKEDVNG